MDNPYRWIVFVVTAFGWGWLLAYTTEWHPLLVGLAAVVLALVTSVIDLILVAAVAIFDDL